MEAQLSTSKPISERIFGVARIAIAIALFAILLYRESIDVGALVALRDHIWTVIAAVLLILSTLPISALRWAIVLKALELPMPAMRVFHIVCIGTSFNQLLFGPTSGDAIRGVYAWRVLRRGGGRIATSIIVDRVFGMLSLIGLAALLIALRWHRFQEVPELRVLAVSLLVTLAAAAIGAVALLAAPALLTRLQSTLQGHPRMVRLLGHGQYVLLAFRRRPSVVSAALILSVLSQSATLLAFVLIARNLDVGNLSVVEYLVSAALALVANTLPITPGGLGVGEAAFDQLCHWIEPVPSTAPYANIFFAFRAISMLTLLIGLVSFLLYRSDRAKKDFASCD
jgi:glycosyltransferase 2 family protein